jgi:hypothetical protein
MPRTWNDYGQHTPGRMEVKLPLGLSVSPSLYPRVVAGVSRNLCGQPHGAIHPHLGRTLRSHTRCLLCSAFHALKRPVFGLFP